MLFSLLCCWIDRFGRLGGVVRDCVDVHDCARCTSIDYAHVGRKGIGVAHRLAFISRNYSEIWGDPWVPTLPNFRPHPLQQRPDSHPAVVSELISNEAWDMEALVTHFSSWEIEEITKILLG
uniref:Uncharacterized protein n=1 Tax=Chenopodium quinoa TaxID=63459 RepID=A0A803LTS1_CHEQI